MSMITQSAIIKIIKFKCGLIGFTGIALLLLTGCSIEQLRQSDEQRIEKLSVGTFASQPKYSDGKLHLERGKSLLAQAGSTEHGIYFARSAFERAAALSHDDPVPYFYSGYTNFLIGKYDEAYTAFLTAAGYDNNSDGWWLASLSAQKANHETIAHSLYMRGKNEKNYKSELLKSYIEKLYSGSTSNTFKKTFFSDASPTEFKCQSADDEIDTYSDICKSDLQFEVFIIKSDADAGSVLGQNILRNLNAAVSGQIAGSDGSSTETADVVSGGYSTTSSAINGSKGYSKALSIDLPGVIYALDVAPETAGIKTVSATPLLSARLGETSKIFSGNNVEFEFPVGSKNFLSKDDGVSIDLDLQEFDETGATIKTAVNISNFIAPQAGQQISKLSIDTSSVELGARIRYDQPILLGSLELTRRGDTIEGEKGTQSLPLIGSFFGQKTTTIAKTEVTVMATIRKPAALYLRQEADFILQLRAMGITVLTNVSRQNIVHEAPSIGVIMEQIMSLNL